MKTKISSPLVQKEALLEQKGVTNNLLKCAARSWFIQRARQDEMAKERSDCLATHRKKRW